jgi:hypothetical protein
MLIKDELSRVGNKVSILLPSVWRMSMIISLEPGAISNQPTLLLQVCDLENQVSTLKSEVTAQAMIADKYKSTGHDTQLLLNQAQDLLQVSTKEVTAAQLQLSKAVEQQLVLEAQSLEHQEQTRGLQRELIK